MIKMCFQLTAQQTKGGDATWEFDVYLPAVPRVGDLLMEAIEGSDSFEFTVNAVCWCLGDNGVHEPHIIVQASEIEDSSAAPKGKNNG
jgi:hypothetical protein